MPNLTIVKEEPIDDLKVVNEEPLPEGWTPQQAQAMRERSASMLDIVDPDRDIGSVRGTLSGVLPAVADIGLSMFPVGFPARVGLSAAGGAAGSIISQKLEGRPLDWGEVGVQAGAGAISEPLSMLGKPIKWAAKKAHIPQTIKWIGEIVTDMTFFGNRAAKALREKLIDRTTKRANDFVFAMAPDVVQKHIGNSRNMLQAISKVKEEINDAYDVYGVALKRLGEREGGIPLDDTVTMVDTLRSRAAIELGLPSETATTKTVNHALSRYLGIRPNSEQGKTLKKLFFESDIVKPADVEYLLANVFKKGKTDFVDLAPDTQSLRVELKDALLADIDTAAPFKKEADKVFKAVSEFNEIERLFRSAMKKNPFTGETKFKPSALADKINANESRIKKRLGIDAWEKIKAEADYYEKMAPEFTKKGASTKESLIGPAAMGLVSHSTGAVVGVEAFGIISAFALLDPTSKKILSGILNQGAKAAVKTGLHMGGTAIDFDQTINPAFGR